VIEALLGSGGMGRVYKAYHPRLRRYAAIKVMGTATDPDTTKRFEREAQAVAALRHPHILAVFDYGEQNGEPYMVLEYMPNGSLADRGDQLPLPPDEVVAILRPVAAALDHAHRQGVIHRDVKPANVFLDDALRPVLGDFGLSKLNRMDSLTVSGTITGTPAFLSPEQARGQRLTAASDIYSLAVMAFLLLTGEPPFTGGSDAIAVLYQHVNELPPPPSQVHPALPAALDGVVLKGMAKAPDDRWPTATEMVDALAHAVGVQAATAPAVALRPARRGRTKGLRTAAASVAVVGLLAGAAYGVTRVWSPALKTGGAAEPTPAPTEAGSVAVDTGQPLKIGGPIKVRGSGLDPTLGARIFIEQAGNGAQIEDDSLITINDNGTFEVQGTVNPELQPGRALVKACSLDSAGHVVDSTCFKTPVILSR
jgi:hypothetical protein